MLQIRSIPIWIARYRQSYVGSRIPVSIKRPWRQLVSPAATRLDYGPIGLCREFSPMGLVSEAPTASVTVYAGTALCSRDCA